MRSFFIITWATLLTLVNCTYAYAQKKDIEITDYCIISGEVDCSRPECFDMCHTRPTPGYERTPFIAPPSRLQTDDVSEIEADRILGGSRVPIPFTYDPLPPEKEPVDSPDPKPALKKDGTHCDYDGSATIEYWKKKRADAEKRVANAKEEQKYLKPGAKTSVNIGNQMRLIRTIDYAIYYHSCYKIDNQCVHKHPDIMKKLQRFDMLIGLLGDYENRYDFTGMEDCQSSAEIQEDDLLDTKYRKKTYKHVKELDNLILELQSLKCE